MQRDGRRHNNDHEDQPRGHEDQPSACNPFDPRSLRIGQRLGEGPTTRKLVTTVQVRKPNRQEYFRVHPDQTYRLDSAARGQSGGRDLPGRPGDRAGDPWRGCCQDPLSDRHATWRTPAVAGAIAGRARTAWNAAAHQAALSAEARWVRIAANKGAGTYDAYEALDQVAEPAWPDLSFERLLEMAFKNRFIDNLDHPVVRRLLGEF